MIRINKPSLITAGGSVELEVASKLHEKATTMIGLEAIIFRNYAEALEIIPYTLAENAGDKICPATRKNQSLTILDIDKTIILNHKSLDER